MTKIVSRTASEAAMVEQLRACLLHHSLGTFTSNGRGVAQVGGDLPTLITQADAVIKGMAQTIEHAAVDLSLARAEATQYSLKVDELESIVENLLGDVSFDEALDHATADLMDCFASSGAADVTADGELSFDERVIFSKEDLKPYLQQAIIRWIERRLEG